MNVRKQVLLLLLFLLFILEGTLIPWILPGSWQNILSPNLVFIVLLFVSIYHNRHTALVLGIIFGMLHDVVFYGDMIGTYSLVMGFSTYIMGFIFRVRRAPMPVMMTVVILGSLLFDSMLYAISAAVFADAVDLRLEFAASHSPRPRASFRVRAYHLRSFAQAA